MTGWEAGDFVPTSYVLGLGKLAKAEEEEVDDWC